MARSTAQTKRQAPARFGSRTDIGCVREHNEDSLVVAPPLYAVADGMGGHAAGEVASEVAVHTLHAEAPAHADTEALASAVVAANYAVINAAQETGRAGMGTTMTACLLEGEHLAIAQVGDSRAYLLHQGRMQQLTRDHSLMADMIEAGEITPAQARVHPQRSVITRALGSDPEMVPDLYDINVSAGDRLLICSDGLTSMVEDTAIETILTRTRDAQRAAAMLVNEAIANGGHDNVTVIVVDVEGNAAQEEKQTRRRGRAWAAIIALAVVAAVCAVVGGVFAWTQGQAYLTANGQNIGIYQGIPQSVAGIELSHLASETDVALADLEPFVASRLQSGVIQTASLEEAFALVGEYRTYIEENKAAEQAAATAKADATKAREERAAQQAAAAQAEANAAASDEDDETDEDADDDSSDDEAALALESDEDDEPSFDEEDEDDA